MSNEVSKGPTAMTWVGLIVGILYAISPVDILPDVVPVAGWIDDLVITGTTVLNFVQQEVGKTSQTLASLLGLVKWAIFGIGIIVVLLIALLGVGIYNAVK